MNNSNPNSRIPHQSLKFDPSSISKSSYDTTSELNAGVLKQQNFVNNYTNFRPMQSMDNDHFNNDNKSYDINRGFSQPNIISHMPDNKYMKNTLYDNLNENLSKETIQEIRLNIDSADRDSTLYPDPFKYIVTFGPVVNSGIDSTINRTQLKNDLRNINKKKKKNNINESVNESVDESVNEFDKEDDLLLYSNDPALIIQYDNILKKIYNPYITRSFVNVKFIRLDNVVLPRFNKIIINRSWNYCNLCNENRCSSCSDHNNTAFIKDDYDRIRFNMINNDRYIPDDNHLGPLFTDRFVLVGIKEIENNQNLATNQLNSSSFTIFPDKYMGILYWRGNPYYAVKIYKDSLLGNINRLSFEFYDSWGIPITLNRTCIDAETNLIINTQILNPSTLDINKSCTCTKFNDFFIEKMNDIIKCFVMINSNIKILIPFYFDKQTWTESEDKSASCSINKILSFMTFNKNTFDFTNIFVELNEFVCFRTGFEPVSKNINGKQVLVTIDQYINDVFWFNQDKTFNTEIINNIKMSFNNYKKFGFKILNKLKIEAMEVPINKYFQNHMMFVMGIYTNELNTKIDYYAR